MRHSKYATALLFLAMLAGSAQAQIKLPVYDGGNADGRNVSFQDAGAGDYQHGKLVRITRNGNSAEPIQGILVRTDAKKALIYVRTEPGAPPRAFPVSDIKRIEKGTIRNVGYTGDVAAPEIRQLVIINGGKRTVSYAGPTLSSGELSQLRDLEAAENELARQEYLGRIEERGIDGQLAMQAKDQETRAMASEFLWQYLARRRNHPDLPLPDSQVVTPGSPYGYGYGYGQSIVMDRRTDEGVVGAFSLLQTGPNVLSSKMALPSDAVTPARRNFLAAQSRAVYENGNLIAVIPNESSEK